LQKVAAPGLLKQLSFLAENESVFYGQSNGSEIARESGAEGQDM
jgi:hypothetical protein